MSRVYNYTLLLMYIVARLQRKPSVNICCTAGQYSGCSPKLTRYFPGSKPYRFSQFILHISRYRYMAVARLQIG